MTKSTSTILLVFILLFTFPIWIGIVGGMFGLVMGLFGALMGIFAGFFGVLGGVLGAIFGAIGEVFSWMFGGSYFDCDAFPSIHFPRPMTVILVAVVIILIFKSRKTTG
jgi:hypothetical protein